MTEERGLPERALPRTSKEELDQIEIAQKQREKLTDITQRTESHDDPVATGGDKAKDEVAKP